MSGAETARRRVVQRRNGGAEMSLPHTRIKSLKLVAETSDKKQFSYFYVQNQEGSIDGAALPY